MAATATEATTTAETIVKGVNLFFGKEHAGFNVWRAAQLLAVFQSAEYLTNNMMKAHSISSRKKMELFAPTTRTIDGLCLEFGVANGTSIGRIASVIGSDKVYGFDGFEGLPETWRPDHPKGMFAQDVPDVPSNAELVIGWFDESLPEFLDAHPDDISFLHIDCDLYSSTKTVFDLAGHRIRPGTVILFDEYFNYPGWQHHEFKAFHEFIAQTGRSYEYLAFTANNKQVLVRITA